MTLLWVYDITYNVYYPFQQLSVFTSLNVKFYIVINQILQSTRIGLRVQYLAMEVATSAQTDEVSFPIMAYFVQTNV